MSSTEILRGMSSCEAACAPVSGMRIYHQSGTTACGVDGTNADRLSLSYNLLTTLPARLIDCKHLRYLRVCHNAMRQIPDVVRLTVLS